MHPTRPSKRCAWPSVPGARQFGFGLAWGALSLPAVARAQQVFEVPAECGSREAFVSGVEALRSQGGALPSPTSVRIAPTASGEYQLDVSGPEVRRSLVDSDCTALFRSAIVIAAATGRLEPKTAADPEVAGPAVPPTPPVQPAAPGPPKRSDRPTSVAPRSAQPASQPREPRQVVPPGADLAAPPAGDSSSAPHLRIMLGGGAVLGLSPDAAALLELGAALEVARWGSMLSFRYLSPDEAVTRGSAGLELRSHGARLSLFHEPWSFLRLEAGLSGYRLTAEGIGIRYPASDSVWLLAPEAEVVLVGRPGDHWLTEVGLHGRVGLSEPRFRVEPETEVYQLPRFGAGLVFRLQWRS